MTAPPTVASPARRNPVLRFIALNLASDGTGASIMRRLPHLRPGSGEPFVRGRRDGVGRSRRGGAGCLRGGELLADGAVVVEGPGVPAAYGAVGRAVEGVQLEVEGRRVAADAQGRGHLVHQVRDAEERVGLVLARRDRGGRRAVRQGAQGGELIGGDVRGKPSSARAPSVAGSPTGRSVRAQVRAVTADRIPSASSAASSTCSRLPVSRAVAQVAGRPWSLVSAAAWLPSSAYEVAASRAHHSAAIRSAAAVIPPGAQSSAGSAGTAAASTARHRGGDPCARRRTGESGPGRPCTAWRGTP